MKKLLLAFATLAAVPAFAQTSVGVSIGINQPGVYGRIDIGNYPQPALVYPQPMIIQPSPVAVYQRPIYLYVPPAHQRDWRRYCSRYSACGQPVYFVREDWVRDRWEHEHERDRNDRDRRDRPGRGNAYGHDRDHRDHGRDNPGRGRGHDRD
ncbi:hypothetical protein JY96_20400 [Aquabacterium sp. NJ1]|uniref:hypothetical protein n=1 Tax=Aquabacterium sp. NJ1 TaxID=1538295 RepID=UPI00052E33D9|nr:hypothetical protein [Aquabacterium sp. NJ1]KGM41627.1 hypothetical protein JY96_20400 [Aquabacterium sp. NJ1]